MKSIMELWNTDFMRWLTNLTHNLMYDNVCAYGRVIASGPIQFFRKAEKILFCTYLKDIEVNEFMIFRKNKPKAWHLLDYVSIYHLGWS